MTDLTAVEAIFFATLEKAAGERDAYLAEACGTDPELRRRVERLLNAQAKAGGFLEADAAALLTTARGTPGEQPGAVVGPYKLLQQLGEGGMGTVFLAEQAEPVRRMVALKIIKPGMDSKAVLARFEAERQALALMDHPNIAKVLEAGATESGRPYFVMELVRGVPVTEFCDEHQLTLRERLALFVPVCQAVQHAHSKGVIHRDLKPGNVLVALYDDKPVPKVIDFGVAKATGEKLTERTLFTAIGSFVGTPEYMSPEQAKLNALDIDTRSDVYALGVLLYELLTGSTPLGRDRLKRAAMDEVLRLIREEEPPRPSTRLSQSGGELAAISARRRAEPGKLGRVLCGELDWIAMKALEKERARRYETASGLAQDIERYLADEPVLACPPSRWYRARKLVRRHKAAAALLAVAMSALILATGVSWLFAVRAGASAREADQRTAEASASAREADRQAGEARAAAERESRAKERAWLHLYVAQMQTAQHAWRDGNVGRLRESLDETRPGADQPDLRGFEWHFLRRLARAEPTTLGGHAGRVRSVAFGAGGRLLVTAALGGADGQTGKSIPGEVRVWDVGTGRVVQSIPGGFGLGDAVAATEKLFALGTEGGGVEIRDLTGDRPPTSLPGDRPAVHSLAFSPDGQQLAVGHGTGSGNAPVNVWDVATGRLRLTLPGHPSYVNSLAFSADGRRLVSGGFEGSVKVWDTTSGRELLAMKSGTRLVSGVAYSPDGTRLASTSGQAVRVWDAKTGEEVRSYEGHAGNVTSVAFSPDGRRLASGGVDRTVRVWDLATRRLAFTLKGHTDSVWALSYSPDGARLASGGSDQTVKVWDATTHPEARVLDGAWSVAFSPDGRLVASGGTDKTIRLRDVAGGPDVHRIEGVASAVAFSPDGKQFATAAGLYGSDRAVKVWDAQRGKQLRSLSAEGFEAHRVAYSPDGRLVAAGGWVGGRQWGVRVWEASTGRPVLVLSKDCGAFGGVAFSPTGDRLAAGNGRQVTLWDVVTGEEVVSFGVRDGRAGAVAFSRDGRWLGAAVDADGKPGAVAVWDLQTGREAFTLLGHTEQITCLAFSSDGQRVAAGTGGFGAQVEKPSVVKVWELRTGQAVLDLDAGSRSVGAVVFSPDGNRLASASSHSLRIWDAIPRADDAPDAPPAR